MTTKEVFTSIECTAEEATRAMEKCLEAFRRSYIDIFPGSEGDIAVGRDEYAWEQTI